MLVVMAVEVVDGVRSLEGIGVWGEMGNAHWVFMLGVMWCGEGGLIRNNLTSRFWDMKVCEYNGMMVLWYVGMLVMYLKLWVCVVGWGMEVGMGVARNMSTFKASGLGSTLAILAGV